MVKKFILLILLILLPSLAFAEVEVLKERKNYDLVLVSVEVKRVVDGDTFVAVFPDGKEERIRLECIDTPERGEEGFEEASRALAVHIGKTTRLKIKRYHKRDNYLRDKYGRILAELYDPMPSHCLGNREDKPST